MSRIGKLAKNTGFIAIGNLGSKLLGFVMLPLYTAWLTPAEFGSVDMMSVYASLLLGVVVCGLSDAIFIFPINATKEAVKSYYTSGMIIHIISAILTAITFYALDVFNLNGFFFREKWGIYALLVTGIFQIFTQNFCRGIDKMSVFCFTGIIHSGTIATLSVILIPKYGVKGYITALAASNATTALFTFIYSKSYNYFHWKSFNYHYLKEMLKYSIPLIPTAVMWWLVSSLNRPLLETYVGISAIGLFAVAGKFPQFINLFYGFFQQAWIVSVVEEIQKKDFNNYFNKMFKTVVSLQIGVCLVVMIFGKYFIRFFTTANYYDAWQYIPCIALAAVLTNMTNFLGSVFSAKKKSKFILLTSIVSASLSIILNYLLIPTWGLWGACTALIAAQAGALSIRIVFVKKYVTFNCITIMFAYIAILSACMGAALFLNGIQQKFLYSLCVLVFFISSKDSLASLHAQFVSKFLSLKR